MPISREEFEQRYAERIKVEENRLLNENKQSYSECKKRKRKEKTKKIIIAIVTLIACACMAFFVVYNEVIMPKREYSVAETLLTNGDEEGAIAAFQALGTYSDADDRWKAIRYAQAEGLLNESKYSEAIIAFNGIFQYKDSAGRIEQIRNDHWLDIIRLTNVSEYIAFGKYEQDNNTTNGQEEIEWLVLEKENDRMLVISKYILDCKPYSSVRGTWETSSLRRWLNNDFFNLAFNEEEKEHIPQVSIIVDEFRVYKDSPKAEDTKINTQDRIFLFGINDVKKHLLWSNRNCFPTVYAKGKGVTTYEGHAAWWLRTVNGNTAAYINRTSGNINGLWGDGYSITEIVGVRPALWIDLR